MSISPEDTIEQTPEQTERQQPHAAGFLVEKRIRDTDPEWHSEMEKYHQPAAEDEYADNLLIYAKKEHPIPTPHVN